MNKVIKKDLDYLCKRFKYEKESKLIIPAMLK